MSHFSGDDLVFYKEDDKIMSGGYLIDSILLKQGLSPMTTLNQSGGTNSTNNKVSNIFENLAVPAGLMYTYKKGSVINNSEYQEGGAYSKKNIYLEDEIHDELLKHIEVNTNKQNANKQNTNTNKKSKKQMKKSKKQSKKMK